MGKRLYPPQIEGTIPAFTLEDEGGAVLTVPFLMNKAVSKSEIAGFELKLKTVQSNIFLITQQSTDMELEEGRAQVRFNIPVDKLNISQYYKIQIAYVDKEGVVGYYSTVGVVKYTSKPELHIENLDYGKINSHIYNYIGVYSQLNGDSTEKVYSSIFNLYDSNGRIVESSGDILHNTSEDLNTYEAKEEFKLNKDLKANLTYYLQYTVHTMNGLTYSTGKYKIMQKETISSNLKAEINTELNYDDGYIDISIKDDTNELYSGTYSVSRASSKEPDTWEELYTFALYDETANKFLFRDYLIEQGVTYKYCIQQYNNKGIYSNRIISKEIYSDFEDMFLFDGKRQLKIKYNPKISSFKKNILESKTDTLGSQFSYISRNGYVDYKEFPISGLISYLMDENNLFNDIYSEDITTLNLVGSNIANEREFKLEVLDWLTNGQPKVLRSPAEGNYIVRLLNTSLAPIDTVGRMLHSFNSTAYEIAEYNYDELKNLGFIQYEISNGKEMRTLTLALSDKDEEGNISYLTGTLNQYDAYYISFNDVAPGSIIYLDDEEIVIGNSGKYKLYPTTPIKKVAIPNDAQYVGRFTYNYYAEVNSSFENVNNVDFVDIPDREFIGEHKDIRNIIEDVKSSIYKIYNFKFTKREEISAYVNNATYYADSAMTILLEPKACYLYKIVNVSSPYYLDGKDSSVILSEDHSYSFYIDGVNYDLTDKEQINIQGIENFEMLNLGSGVILNASYQLRVIEYSIEETNSEIAEFKRRYENNLNKLEEMREAVQAGTMSPAEYASRESAQIALIEKSYQNYISALTKALE